MQKKWKKLSRTENLFVSLTPTVTQADKKTPQQIESHFRELEPGPCRSNATPSCVIWLSACCLDAATPPQSFITGGKQRVGGGDVLIMRQSRISTRSRREIWEPPSVIFSGSSSCSGDGGECTSAQEVHVAPFPRSRSAHQQTVAKAWHILLIYCCKILSTKYWVRPSLVAAPTAAALNACQNIQCVASDQRHTVFIVNNYA